jgi:hypothetical protein
MNWVPPWWAASILANVAIAGVEYLNRAGNFDTFGRALLTTGPLILAAQYGLFYSWRDAPSFMLAWAFFTAGNGLIRLVSAQYMVGEGLNTLTLVGTSIIFAGAYVVKAGSAP